MGLRKNQAGLGSETAAAAQVVFHMALPFSDCLTPLSVIISGFTHVAANGMISFFDIAEQKDVFFKDIN